MRTTLPSALHLKVSLAKFEQYFSKELLVYLYLDAIIIRITKSFLGEQIKKMTGVIKGLSFEVHLRLRNRVVLPVLEILQEI